VFACDLLLFLAKLLHLREPTDLRG